MNVALLLPEAQWVTRSGLAGALTDHYRSPGRLADYREKFEKVVRRDGEDPSIFVTELETLAVRAFGDVGPGGQIRMVRDRFVTGHRDCDLRRHLDSVHPDTQIREIVDRCRVWESHWNAYDRDDVAPTFTGPRLAKPIVTPTITEPWSVEPVTPVTVVRTTNPMESTVLEVLVRKLLDQMVTCNEGHPIIIGPRLVKPTVTGDLLVFTEPWSIEPVVLIAVVESTPPGTSKEIESLIRELLLNVQSREPQPTSVLGSRETMLQRLQSIVTMPELTPRSTTTVREVEQRQSFLHLIKTGQRWYVFRVAVRVTG